MNKMVLLFKAGVLLVVHFMLPNLSLALGKARNKNVDEVMKALEGKTFPLSVSQVKGVLDGSILPEDFLNIGPVESIQNVNALKKPGKKKKGKTKAPKSKKTKKPKAEGGKKTKKPKLTLPTWSTVKVSDDVIRSYRANFGFDETKKLECDQLESASDSCDYLYDYTTLQYSCVCTKKSSAAVFLEIDKNGDGTVVLQEFNDYYKSQDCQFPFTYKADNGTTSTYTACTTVDDSYPWCSIKTDINGVHVDRFFKYCTDSGMEYFSNWVWAKYDTNKDNKLTLEEILNTDGGVQAEASSDVECGNDCGVLPQECANPVLREDPKCRNLYKTVPLQDEELLRLLADAQLDAYYQAGVLDNNVNYFTVPTNRTGSWLSVIERSKYQLNSTDPGVLYTTSLAVCLWLVEINKVETIQALLASFAAPSSIVIAFELGLGDIFCSAILLTKPKHWMDGKDIVTWSLYKIEKGKHQGKKILSFMGTDFFRNGEQVLIDVYGVPLNKPMAYNIIEEATQIAKQLKPDYITGHSLGGYIAEGVCSETGISGASFAALGNHDPSGKKSNFKNILHHNTKFEVVVNKNDITRLIGSPAGYQCNHIAKSCDMRLLDFTGALMGHSSVDYLMEAGRNYSIGWESKIMTNNSNAFLPGVMKNQLCDSCRNSSYCQSGLCYDGYCVTFHVAPQPTYCPQPNPLTNSRTPWDDRTPCFQPNHCASGVCVDKKYCSNNCKADSDCLTGRCEGYFGTRVCTNKLAYGEGCNENDDCTSNRCDLWKWTSWISGGWVCNN